MRQFDRRVSVTVDTIRFEALDCVFRVRKSLKPEPNTCELTIYNLNEDHRNQLEAIVPRGRVPATKGIACLIEAGYKDGVSLVWNGDLRTAETLFEGPDVLTVLSSGDGEKAWRHAREHVAFGPKTPVVTALRAMARALGVGEGNLSQVVAKLQLSGSAIYPTGKVISGSVSRELLNLARSADLEVSVQDGALFFLDRGQMALSTPVLISERTGMVGQPTIDSDGVLHVRTKLNPEVRVGHPIVLESRRLNGLYRVEVAETICDTSGNDWYIDLECKTPNGPTAR